MGGQLCSVRSVGFSLRAWPSVATSSRHAFGLHVSKAETGGESAVSPVLQTLIALIHCAN